MKTRTQNRTPKRLLSVFLSILMVLSAVVVGNPFVVEAASKFNLNPSGGSCDYIGSHAYRWRYTSDDDSDGLDSEAKITYYVYDANSETSNYITCPISFDSIGVDGNATNSKFSIIDTYVIEVEYIHGDNIGDKFYFPSKTQSRNGCNLNELFMWADDPNTVTYADSNIEMGVVLYINTTRICNLYDSATSTYGAVNVDEYSASSWNAYITAYNKVKDYVTNGVHVMENGVEDIDLQKKLTVACDNLEEAIANLKHATVTIRDIYKQVDGATIAGSSEIELKKAFNVTVDLHDGYTQSTPQVRVSYKDGTYKDFSGTRNGNKFTYSVTIDNGNVSSIMPINVNKNTYTVSVQTSATGLSITNSGNHTVTHGDNFVFTVTRGEEYTQRTPVVKVNNVEIAGVQSGNTYTYTISGIKENKNVTIDNLEVNKYNVSVPEKATGLSITKSGNNTVEYNKDFTFTVTRGEEYTQRTPVVKVNDTVITGTQSGNTFTYTIKNIKENKTVTVDNLEVNKYTVTVPEKATGLSITKSGNNTVEYDKDFTFTVTRGEAYTQRTPVVKVNGTEIAGVQSGNTYTYTISGIKENKTVTVGDLEINKYKYDFSTGEGYTLADNTGFDHTAITHGNDYKFTVTVKKEYTQNTPVVSIKSGKDVTLESKADGADGSLVYTYIVKNVTAHDEILVAAMSKNTYSAVLPFDADGSYKVTNAKANAENVVEGIVYGTDLTFGVALGEQYNRSKITVKYKGTVLTPDEAGNYTISNITENIVEGDIVVEGVKLNNYYITLPIDSESGFTIEVGKGLNAKAVLSGTDFNFKLFLDPAYSNSKPVVKYSSKGGAGNSYVTLEAKNGNEYTIENVLSDCIVVVENVKKNTYTVKFVDENGNLYEDPQTVEYGKDAVYGKNGGMMPSKDAELISDETVDGVRTVVTKEYKFIGWSQETTNVTSDMEVTPIFEVSEVTKTYPKEGGDPSIVVTPKTANVIFLSDGLIVHKETVEKGTKFPGWNGAPVKTSKNPYETYTFLGWDIDKDGDVDFAAGAENAIDEVNDDVTFVAVFESNLPSQTVTFKSWNGEQVLYTASVKRGEEARYGLSMIPSRTDKKYEYTFEGWSYAPDADENNVLEKLVVAENDITVFAAYSKEIINYTYKFVNDGVELQKGSYNFVISPEEDTVVKYTGKTPERASTKDKVFTFDGWKATTPSRYSTVYEATYTSETREYGYTLPTADGATVALGDGIGETVKFGENLVFTVTLDEGHDQNAPVVKSNNTELTGEMMPDGRTYVYVINADGADATEIENKLNDITVSTTVNEYLVKLTYVDEYGVEKEVFNGLVKHGKSPSYVDPAKPAEANGVYKLVGWDTNKDGKADITGRIENVKKAITGVAVFEYDHRHDGNPDDPDGVWELYPDLTQKADCTHAGSKTYGCKHCGITKVVAIPARCHNFTEWHIDKAPTCTETGLKSRHCQNTVATDEYEACSYAENGVVIPATGHHDSDGDYKCDDCGADLGHCSSCICHKGNVLSKIIRKICTLLSKTFHTKIKCCKCMEWYGDKISSIS